MCNRSFEKSILAGALFLGLLCTVSMPGYTQDTSPFTGLPQEMDNSAAPSPSPAPLLPGGVPRPAAPDTPDTPDFFGANGILAPEPSLDGGEDFQFEKSEDELEEEARKEAFSSALQGVLPLRPMKSARCSSISTAPRNPSSCRFTPRQNPKSLSKPFRWIRALRPSS